MPIRKRKREDGTVAYDVREYVGLKMDGTPDRRSETCATLKEAKVAQAKMVAKREAMGNRSGRYRLGDYVEDRWWPALADKSPTTRDTYEKRLRRNILPALGNRDIGDITHVDVQRMADSCPTTGVAKQAVSVLKTALNFAMNQDRLITHNPAVGSFTWGQAPSRKRDSGVVITRFEDMRPLVDAVRAHGDDSLLKVVLTGLYMGLRPEERYALNWDDFDWERRYCVVDDAVVSASRREGGVQQKRTKTEKGNRLVPMPREVAAELRELSRDGRIARVGPFILGANRKRVSPSTMQGRWTRFLDANPGLPRVTIENMRHSFATSYLAAGGKVERLREIMGHTDIKTTYRYVRPAIEDLRDSVDAVVSF